MSQADYFRCGHEKSTDNVRWEYGARVCRACRNRRSRERAQRKRAEFIAQYGHYRAVPDEHRSAA